MRSTVRIALSLLAAFAVGACPSLTQASKTATRKPGHYVVWASNDAHKCESAVALVNRMPAQSLEQAAYVEKRPGFFTWQPLSALDLGLAIAQIRLPTPDGKDRFVLLWTTFVANAETHVLYVVDSLPTNREQIAKVMANNEVFSSYGSHLIEQAQQKYGAKWTDWFLTGQATVVAVDGDRPTFFATVFQRPDSSSPILVFEIDDSGMRKDLCMLRRICSCAKICRMPLHDPRERAELIPSPRYCSSSRAR